MFWKCGRFTFDCREPQIMGILNMTPDSFSDGGEHASLDDALAHAREMVQAGAVIIDVGGESTRPGAIPVDPEEEWARIREAVAILASEGICVSVDTRNPYVARMSIEAGASIINDVSGFGDPEMVDVVKDAPVGLVVMHMKGVPATMQDDPTYIDVVSEVSDFLSQRTDELLEAGISHDRICIDPGPGFGKDARQTLELMRNIQELRHIGYPIMVAASRKSYIASAYRIDDEDPKARDAASAREALLACELGASIVRTHNVRATAEELENLRPYAVLGLGSNIALVADDGEEAEGKKAQINLAIASLCQLPDSLVVDIAPFYGSKAAYKEDQEDFVNTVVLIRTGIPPKELLDYLHAIEATLGRRRVEENGPRTIDIDLLDFELYLADAPELTLPHPRAQERDFVVKPFSDILPGHVLANGIRIDAMPEGERLGRAWRI